MIWKRIRQSPLWKKILFQKNILFLIHLSLYPKYNNNTNMTKIILSCHMLSLKLGNLNLYNWSFLNIFKINIHKRRSYNTTKWISISNDIQIIYSLGLSSTLKANLWYKIWSIFSISILKLKYFSIKAKIKGRHMSFYLIN